MVKVDTTTPRSYSGPPSASAILTRQFSSLLLIVLLYTAATPFQPFSWLVQVPGGFLFDTLLAGIILFCAFYFQWQIASLTASVVVSIPAMGGTAVRNGRLEPRTSNPIWLWRTADYWPFAVAEALALAMAEWGPSELLRRGIVVAVVAGLWVLGWSATPRSYKTWAWEHIKVYLFLLILDEIRRVGWGYAGGNARRGRQRW
ncbi:hypothetical protein QBC46DRAFT_102067 [Diplogelasinospora grovesii]|uniref:Uncharacterized protein n=1 Tax=Diplogelasinospora grovesii TaxID=303347 RepID=A0AAN6N935_9PEZI|nr:hypothetical protein QBC46DRAFT_102067 [Diplogelasinospora grovesii]